jgi:hypothetical protein
VTFKLLDYFILFLSSIWNIKLSFCQKIFQKSFFDLFRRK